jgi:hypothetical protein
MAGRRFHPRPLVILHQQRTIAAHHLFCDAICHWGFWLAQRDLDRVQFANDLERPVRGQQPIIRVRRQYNQWVANQTLEDYALRFTAERRGAGPRSGSATPRWAPSRSWPARRSAARSRSPSASPTPPRPSWRRRHDFLLTGLPIGYYAAKSGVDIDLLTRGAGFGYIGSTITSLIYASFTFILFASKATIMSQALSHVLGIPIADRLSRQRLVVMPIAAYGIR